MEKLNARAGIYALSFTLWHGTKIVSMHAHRAYGTPNAEIATPDRPIDILAPHR